MHHAETVYLFPNFESSVTMGKDSQTITGILVPSGWDEEGKIIEVAVSTFDEEFYFVEEESLNALLLSMLQKEVVVKGVVSERDGRNQVFVQDMKPKSHTRIAIEGKCE